MFADIVRRLHSVPLLARIVVAGVLCSATASLSATWLAYERISSDWIERASAGQRDALSILLDNYNPDASPWSVREGHLHAGEEDVEAKADTLADRFSKKMSGTIASVFRGDVRVATTVFTKEGKRAVGSTFAKGPGYDAVYGRGEA